MAISVDINYISSFLGVDLSCIIDFKYRKHCFWNDLFILYKGDLGPFGIFLRTFEEDKLFYVEISALSRNNVRIYLEKKQEKNLNELNKEAIYTIIESNIDDVDNYFIENDLFTIINGLFLKGICYVFIEKIE